MGARRASGARPAGQVGARGAAGGSNRHPSGWCQLACLRGDEGHLRGHAGQAGQPAQAQPHQGKDNGQLHCRQAGRWGGEGKRCERKTHDRWHTCSCGKRRPGAWACRAACSRPIPFPNSKKKRNRTGAADEEDPKRADIIKAPHVARHQVDNLCVQGRAAANGWGRGRASRHERGSASKAARAAGWRSVCGGAARGQGRHCLHPLLKPSTESTAVTQPCQP